jgi:hypothetical protein
MGKSLRLHIVLLASIVLVSNYAFAQLDSLYTQQWNRDPVNNLSATASAQRQIITAEQIRVSGYTRLSDLVQLFDGWTFTFRDGNTWLLQSNGTGAYDYQNWILMVNGQRVELNRAYTPDLNLLGISVADIERIEIINTNGMYLGEFTQNGLINIITKKSSQDGLSYRGYYGISVNSLDTKYEGQNTSQTVGYTKNRFHLNASFGYLVTNLSDSALKYPNVFPVSTSKGISEKISYRLESQYTGNKFSHQVYAALLQNGRAAFSFMDYQAGYLGQFSINKQNQIRLSTTYLNEQTPVSNSNLSTSSLQYRYLKPYKTGNLIWQTGIATDLFWHKYDIYTNLTYTDALRDNRFATTDTNVVIIKPYTSINIPITRKVNLFSDIQAAFAHGKIAPRISVGMYKRLSLISNYSFVVAYTETLLEEAFMTNIGQRVNAIEGATYFYNPKLATADFYYNLNIGNNVKFSFNSGLKNTYALPGIEYRLDSTNSSPTGVWHWDRTKRSTYNLNWINRFNIHYDIVKNLTFDINYLNTRSLNTWNENLQNIPKHKFTFTLKYDLPKRFTLWSRNYLQSETKFWNYPGLVDPYTNQLYATVPYIFTWDLGISKKLFKDYLYFNFSVRNLLNTNERYYPTGAQLGTRFTASITANIDGLFAKGTTNP